ncbi:MAG: xanthine dehydrogenase accessory factor [Pseudonocardiales bacterium]|jgi:xanthine dehydrogenase accessory factor|nr:xanthine dehydrogenase accessory factor [Pseudonocardiales bacterium]MDT4929517.1 xanthine dehydrogenase accessory factor [Pseudonocardiales bacterium]
MTKPSTTRVSDLTTQRVPFVHATVVRAQVPTSARAGDDAIVLGDGSIEGFVGGQCAESSVRTAALAALQDGESVLLRVLPEGDVEFPESPGARVVVNTCLSGGALEIFLEPMLPAPLVEVVGHTPIAEAVVAIAELLGYATGRSLPGPLPAGASAVIVASHGSHELETIRAALDAEVGHIALVASRKRGSAVLDELGCTEAERTRISTPAGLDIGARTAPEVALSIMAEVVAAVRRSGPTPKARAAPTDTPTTAVDPVCGMTVTIMRDTPHLVVDGESLWFCNPHCRDSYATIPGQ